MKQDLKSEARKKLEAQVAAHPFLIGLQPRFIELLADCALSTQFASNQLIFRAGETANRFYLIERGSVDLESSTDTNGPIVIDSIGTGDLLGWSWIFPPYKWHFDARATEPTSAIFFYGTILREYCEKEPALGYELFKRMSSVMMRRLQKARAGLIEAMKSPC